MPWKPTPALSILGFLLPIWLNGNYRTSLNNWRSGWHLMWCKYPRLGVPAAQGLGSPGGISLLNGGLCVYLCCKWKINWSASFQLPERISTVRLWLAASQHLHCWLYFTSSIPVLIPCGMSDISVRMTCLWCCSPRVFLQVCSWTPCWWCSKVRFYSPILLFVLQEKQLCDSILGLVGLSLSRTSGV